MTAKPTSRDVSAKAAVDAIRGPLSNQELMERFKISPLGFADLLKQLFEKRLISRDDMIRRGIRFRVKKAQIEPEPVAVVAPPRVPAVAPAPSEGEEEFLDTVQLTELFTSFKPPPPSESEEPAEQETVSPEGRPSDPHDRSGKKGKFSITGLFKKGR
jgi:hypothetical protein